MVRNLTLAVVLGCLLPATLGADEARPCKPYSKRKRRAARRRQIRYLTIEPKRPAKIERIELLKGPDDTAPAVMAITLESPSS